MNEIYLISEGEYSDYHIVAAFSTFEKAKDFIEENGDEYIIEQINVDEKIEHNGAIWEVRFGLYNTNELIEAITNNFYKKDLVYVDDYYFEAFTRKLTICFTLFAETRTKAVKIASERLAFIKSNPYLFPLLNVKCVEPHNSSYSDYPKYNFKTMEIDIDDSKKINEYYAKMVDVALGKDKTATEEQREEALVALKLKQPKPKPKQKSTKARVMKVDRFGQIIEQKRK